MSGRDSLTAVVAEIEGRGRASDLVPRQLLLDAQEAVERLQQQLSNALADKDSEVTAATNTLQAQLKATQKQQKTAEEQLERSLARERGLRESVNNTDMINAIALLRRENKQLREQNETLSEQAIKGEDHAGQLILIRNKYEAAQEELQRQKAGSSLELRSMQEEVGTLKRALENAEHDKIQGERALRQEKEMKEAIERSAELLKGRDRQILRLQEELDQSTDRLALSDDEARKVGHRASELERELRKEQKRVEEAIVVQEQMESAHAKQASTIAALEDQLSHAQGSLAKISERLQETELELVRLQKEMESLEQQSSKDAGSLTMQLRDTQSQLESVKEASASAEEEYRSSRGKFRQELQSAESEARHLREVLRKERDLLENMMRDHTQKETENTLKKEHLEAAAARREKTLHERLQSAEKELDALRMSSISDSKYRTLQDQFKREKEQLQTRLDIALEDVKRSEQQRTSDARRLEQKLVSMTAEADMANSKLRSLERQAQEAEEACSSERKARLVVAEQLRVFKGECSYESRHDEMQLSKVAQAALELVGDTSHVYESIEKQLAEPIRDKIASQQRTALGVVVVGNTVETTVPGSPAASCGLVSPGDEILAVDGKKVLGSAVTAALRGNDWIGDVVSLLLRKPSSKEVLEVYLPRTDILVLQRRQEVMEDLVQFSKQAVAAVQSSQPEVLDDRLEKVLAGVQTLEQLDFSVQHKLGLQVVELRKGLNHAIQKAWQAIKQVDRTHQQVHALQDQNEERLREQLSKLMDAKTSTNLVGEDQDDSTGNMQKLHQQIHTLGKEVIQLTTDLDAKNMLLAEASRDAQTLREALLQLEEKAVACQEGQKAMRQTLSDVEEQLTNALAENVEFSFAVAIGLHAHVGSTGSEVKGSLDNLLRDGVSQALRVPKTAVGIICFYREAGHLQAVLKLCSVISADGNVESGLRTAKALASELSAQFADSSSVLRQGRLGAVVQDCVLQGPLSELTIKSIRNASLDAEQDDQWRQDELTRMREEIVHAEWRVQEAHNSRLHESEDLRRQLQDFENSAAKIQGNGHAHDLDISHKDLVRQHQTEIAEMKRQYQVEIDRSTRAIRTKEYEISVLKQQLADWEVRDSERKSKMEERDEMARTEREANHKLQKAATQMRQLVEPEVRACIATLNNVESEMEFFHTHQLRTLQIAKSIAGDTFVEDQQSGIFTKDQKDIAYSKEMMQRDMNALRDQLAGLVALTAPDGELARQIGSVSRWPSARATPSRDGQRSMATDTLGATQATAGAALEQGIMPRDGSGEEGYALQGHVVEVQNLPQRRLIKAQISAAISVLPGKSDADTFEHALHVTSHRSTPYSISSFFHRIGGQHSSKMGKERTLISPQFLTASLEAENESKWPAHAFCLRQCHSLEPLGAPISGSSPDVKAAHDKDRGAGLGGAGLSVLVTLMARSGTNEEPSAFARAVLRVAVGDNLDEWCSLEDTEGAILSDDGNPASIRVQASYFGGKNSIGEHDASASSLMWKAKNGSYAC